MLRVMLRVVGGETEAAELPLELPAIIGRGPHASVNLSHPLVSRQHCELLDDDGQLMVRDLDSLNGTFVGSERIVEAILRPGELLTVGTVTFRAVYDAAEPAGAVDEEADSSVLPQWVGVSSDDDTVRAASPETARSTPQRMTTPR